LFFRSVQALAAFHIPVFMNASTLIEEPIDFAIQSPVIVSRRRIREARPLPPLWLLHARPYVARDRRKYNTEECLYMTHTREVGGCQ
jgi:hypothetical protein